MTTQGSVPLGSPAAHPNARRIKSLYTAIQNADLTGIAACYDEHAYFQDIAFRRHGEKEIMEMWRYVCHGKPQVTFDPNAISADDRKGSGRWRAKYRFGKTDTKPGRPVDNAISSAFAFRNGLIVEHRDRCNAMAWARQALPFPVSLIAGTVAPLRRYMAALKLHKFSKEAKP
jgi:ketosteroid isomerase-like protein